jgi:hypothetical protein
MGEENSLQDRDNPAERPWRDESVAQGGQKTNYEKAHPVAGAFGKSGKPV